MLLLPNPRRLMVGYLTGALLTLLLAGVLASGRDEPIRERRKARSEGKQPPRW